MMLPLTLGRHLRHHHYRPRKYRGKVMYLKRVVQSIHPSVCPQGEGPISHNALQHLTECHVGRGVPGSPLYPDPPPGGTKVRVPPGGVPMSRYPPGGVPRSYPPGGYRGPGTPLGGLKLINDVATNTREAPETP